MRAIYLDCFAGISASTLLGAFLDSGLPEEYLRQELSKLPLSGYRLDITKVRKQGISCYQALLYATGQLEPRSLAAISKAIDSSALSTKVKEAASGVFMRLALAEAKVHGGTIDTVHLHEVGADDAIVAVVGCIIGLQYLGIEYVAVSRLHVGSGFTKCAHGLLPVPAPATAELLTNIPFYATDIEGELVTPTGAAIVAELGNTFGAMPASFRLERVAYGSGSQDLAIANVLRIYIGEIEAETDHTNLKVIETNIDDLSPQLYSHVMEKLYASGAGDVYLTAIVMKKGRPGTKLTVVVRQKYLKATAKVIFSETSSIGMRVYDANTIHLNRQITTVETKWGPVKVKIGKLNDEVLNVSPEYEDLKQVADKQNIPLKVVQTAVIGQLASYYHK